MISICVCALPETIRYSILLRTPTGVVEKETRPNTASLGILNMMLPIIVIVAIHTCPFDTDSREMRNKNEKEGYHSHWEWNSTLCTQFNRKWRDILMFFFIGFGYGGTDGARTRSFRLDRAVLWPIELQSRRNKTYSIHILIISFKPFLFRLKAPCCNRDVSDIHMNIHFSESCLHCWLLVTLNRLRIHFSTKKKSIFVFILFFSLDFHT